MKNNMTMMSVVRKWVIEPRPHLYSKALMECMGSMMFHFIGSVSPTPIANGMALMVIVYYVAHVTGAHLNPSLSLTFCLLGYINPLELLAYWCAQIAGCVFGALWLAALVPGIWIGDLIPDRIPGMVAYDGCFVPDSSLTRVQVFGWEAVGTFTFLVPIFSVVWYTLRKKGYGTTGPLMVGLSLFASALAVGSFTGAALNPARALGSAIVFKCPESQKLWLYVLGELTGAICVPIAIIPWYGISPEAWYLRFVPLWLIKQMRYYQPSLKLITNDVEEHIAAVVKKHDEEEAEGDDE